MTPNQTNRPRNRNMVAGPAYEPTNPPNRRNQTMGKSLIRRKNATIPKWLITRDDWTTYRSGPLRTFALLSLMADAHDMVTVSYAQLADEAKTENRTLVRHIDHLCSIGAVTRVSGDRVNANTYHLHMDAPAPGAIPDYVAAEIANTNDGTAETVEADWEGDGE